LEDILKAKSFSLNNRTIVITGALGGIGSVMAEAMAEAGADVSLIDVEASRSAANLLDRIRRKGRRALYLQADVGRSDQIADSFATIVDAFGGIDVLVNNATVVRMAHVVDLSEDHWNETIQVNLTGAFLCAKAVGGIMLSRKRGSIINIVSIGALIGLPRGLAHYAAAKAGMIGLTRTLAVEWARSGVRVNAIAPGQIMTEGLRRVMDNQEYARQILERIPLGRVGTPDEVASAAIFLASDASSFVTGHTLVVDGGITAS
jgi:NAD(P)-dependent dehydrogenase (short-subunit alcohol dehydrogenase family)